MLSILLLFVLFLIVCGVRGSAGSGPQADMVGGL